MKIIVWLNLFNIIILAVLSYLIQDIKMYTFVKFGASITIWTPHCLRGLVKLKQIQKLEKNSDWTDPIPYPIFDFFLNIRKNENNTKKQKNSPKNKNPSWGLSHPPTSEFFSDFWIFLTWQNPLAPVLLLVQ